MKHRTVYDILEREYDTVLTKILDGEEADDMYDLMLYYESKNGTTIKFSWKDREIRLLNQDKYNDNNSGGLV